jgi:CRP-like cAMP-binding protein
LLAALPPDDYRRLSASLEVVHCQSGVLLLDEGQPVDSVYFPATCVAARLCTLGDGLTVEQSIVGCDGVVGVPAFLGGGALPWRVQVLVGGSALRMTAAALAVEFQRGGTLQRLLLQYVQRLIVDVSSEAVCRTHHTVERRLARLLLQVVDRWPGDDLALTQEGLGLLLGARRETVCHATARLQEQGAIRHERGHVIILDAQQLGKASCECYRRTGPPVSL